MSCRAGLGLPDRPGGVVKPGAKACRSPVRPARPVPRRSRPIPRICTHVATPSDRTIRPRPARPRPRPRPALTPMPMELQDRRLLAPLKSWRMTRPPTRRTRTRRARRPRSPSATRPGRLQRLGELHVLDEPEPALHGYARSTDGGQTFTDLGALPASSEGDAGDRSWPGTPSRGGSTCRRSASTPATRSRSSGPTTTAPPSSRRSTVRAGGSSTDKDWITVDNAPGDGQGTVYLAYRDFGAGDGIYLSRSTNGGDPGARGSRSPRAARTTSRG